MSNQFLISGISSTGTLVAILGLLVAVTMKLVDFYASIVKKF